jgi:hypothetical protein
MMQQDKHMLRCQMQDRDMADLSRLVDELSSLTVLEATELAKLLEVRWQPSKEWRSRAMTAEELEKRNIEKMGKALGKQYSVLCHEVTILHLYWKEYTELFGTNQKRIDQLNQSAAGFFRMLQDELFSTNVLHIARLTDSTTSIGKSNLTIRNLPELVTDATLKKRLTELLKVVDDKAAFCRDWRHRRFAHHDLALAINEKAKPLEQGSREQIAAALKAMADVLNAVELHYFRGGTSFDAVHMPNGAVTLLYLLGDGIKEKSERAERIKNGNALPTDVQEQI